MPIPKIRLFAKSDTVSIKAAVGFQPRYILCGAAGNLVIVPKSDPDNPFTYAAPAGAKIFARDILRINSASTTVTTLVAVVE